MSSLQRKIYSVNPKEEFHEKGYRPISADFWDGFVIVAKRLPEAMKAVQQKFVDGRTSSYQSVDDFEFEVIGIANDKVKSGIILASFYGV